MKKGMLIVLLIAGLLPQAASAQGWRLRLLEQIAALRVQLGYVKKGYGIIRDGTGAISRFKDGEFTLHRHYLDSLAVVSPAIRTSSRIPDIIALYEAIEKRRRSLVALLPTESRLSPPERHSLRLLLTEVRDRADAEAGQLELVLTDGKLKLTDDERTGAIETCYERMRLMYRYQKRLQGQLAALLAVRGSTLRDSHLLRLLHGLESRAADY